MPYSGLPQLRASLLKGKISSVDLVEQALARIADSKGEGARTFTLVLADEAREQALQADVLYSSGRGSDFPLLGIPISVKDLFDLKGHVTTAGSTVLAEEAPADKDAAIVARLRAAGAVIVGRTNMTEFAFSGLGLNPHYGTPRNPWDRSVGRIPGGSSSGAAVSVTDGMCLAAIGTDTGGSVRIPAALCGLAGFKPTQSTVPLAGAYPLSTTLDSIGPLARTIEDCNLIYDVLSGSRSDTLVLPRMLRLAAPVNYLLDGLDEAVAADFDAALGRLTDAGHNVEQIEVPGFNRIVEAGRIGTFPAIEAFALQKERLRTKGDAFDPWVRRRIEAADKLPADALMRLNITRRDIIADVSSALGHYDAFLYPTVPMVAPPIAELADERTFGRINLLMLRNPTVVNFIDGCAASIPMHQLGTPPTGLSIAGFRGMDRKVLAISMLVHDLLCGGATAGGSSNIVCECHSHD